MVFFGLQNINHRILFGLLLIFVFLACPNDTKQPPAPTPTPSPDGKTYLKIDNTKGKYAVNVYLYDPPLYNDSTKGPRLTVPEGGTGQFEALPTAAGNNGDNVYFEYLIPVESVRVPYYPRNTTENVKYPKIEAGETTTVEAPTLSTIETDSAFILVRNNTNDNIWFQQGPITRNPFNSSDRNIAKTSNALFVFGGDTSSLSDCTIGDNTRWNFPNTTIEKGKIYTFIHNGLSNPGLYLMQHFDPAMQKGIWTIPTYDKPSPGRFFTVGLLQSRRNVKNDGYILVGRVNYGEHTVEEPQVGAIPYLGFISPSGDITMEKKIVLRKNPTAVNLRQFYEDSNSLIFAGQAYYEASAGQPFILGTDLNGEVNFFYDNFIDDIYLSDQSLEGLTLVKLGSNEYAVGCERYNLTAVKSEIYIAKTAVSGWDAVSHEEFWLSPAEDNTKLVDLMYDQSQNMFIVVAYDYAYYDKGELSSILYFVNAANRTQKYPPIKSTSYAVNKIFTVGQDYYVAGSYSGASKFRGFVAKLNIVNGTLGNLWFIDSTKYVNGSVNIQNILVDNDGKLVLGGWCVEDSGNDKNSVKWQPWLVKYDLSASAKIWEQIYEDPVYMGYYVYSVHHNAIGSYLLEIYNGETYHSYLISTDLLGRMGTNMLAPLPRNSSSIFTANAPAELGISVSITPLSDAGLSVKTLTLNKGQSGTISVQGTWSSYRWYINGEPVSGSSPSFSFTTSGRNVGVYTVTAVVTNSANEKRSASCHVTVTN